MLEKNMESAQYWVALLTMALFTPFLFIWFVVHPFTGMWRRIGPIRTWLCVTGILFPVPTAVYHFRESLLVISFGFSWSLAALALVFFVASIIIAGLRGVYLKAAIRFGWPQLADEENPGKLLTEGIYSRIRHPTYIEGGLALTSMALFSNYLAVYVLLAAYFPLIYLVVLMEERELSERFGEEYVRYSEEVPRFIPKMRSKI